MPLSKVAGAVIILAGDKLPEVVRETALCLEMLPEWKEKTGKTTCCSHLNKKW